MCNLGTGSVGSPTKATIQVWASGAVPPWATLTLTANEQFNWTCQGVFTGGSSQIKNSTQWQNTIDVGLYATSTAYAYGWVDVTVSPGTFINVSYNWL